MTLRDHPWLNALKVYTHPRVVGMLFLGFSAGLPLLLVLGTLSFWLSEAGIARATIGHLELGGAGVRLQVPVVAAGGPAAAAVPDGAAGQAAGVAAAVAGLHCRRAARHGEHRPGAEPGAHGVLRAGGRLRLGDAGHRARRLPHRGGGNREAGCDGGDLPGGLSHRDDHRGRGRAVDRGERRHGRDGLRLSTPGRWRTRRWRR